MKEPYIEDLLAQTGDTPVFNLALMPTEGLASVTQAVADSIGAKMAELNSRNITVWLRYAHEANGDCKLPMLIAAVRLLLLFASCSE